MQKCQLKIGEYVYLDVNITFYLPLNAPYKKQSNWFVVNAQFLETDAGYIYENWLATSFQSLFRIVSLLVASSKRTNSTTE